MFISLGGLGVLWWVDVPWWVWALFGVDFVIGIWGSWK